MATREEIAEAVRRFQTELDASAPRIAEALGMDETPTSTVDDGKGEGAMRATYRAALDAWYATGSTNSADALAEIENEVCAALAIPLDETEQGLTPTAEAIIREWLNAA